jgi:hypothetical protein
LTKAEKVEMKKRVMVEFGVLLIYSWKNKEK